VLGREVLRREVWKHLGAAAPGPASGQPAFGPPPDGEESQEEDDGDTATDGRSLLASAVVGIGLGSRELQWPRDGEIQDVDTGMFAAFELAARFAVPLSESVELGTALSYQSSISQTIEETHLAAATESVGIRSHHFGALRVLGVQAGEALAISPSLGYGTRSLRPAVHNLLTPSYSLAGPIARVELSLTFGDTVTLALAPELQWILVGDELEEEGIDESGVSVGGEALFEVALSRALAIGLTFRQAHALLSASSGSATDMERFITTRLRWTP
jgi:hypothetical protein